MLRTNMRFEQIWGYVVVQLPQALNMRVTLPALADFVYGPLTGNTSFPRTQGEAPSQYYVPLAGFFVHKYLSSLQLKNI